MAEKKKHHLKSMFKKRQTFEYCMCKIKITEIHDMAYMDYAKA